MATAPLLEGVFVFLDCTFNMFGGTISYNAATSDGWMNGNGAYGGGVSVWYGTFNMTDGTISCNSVDDDDQGAGGGVYVTSGTFTMSGGEISGNVARSGGGVFIDYLSSFSLSSTKNANEGL